MYTFIKYIYIYKNANIHIIAYTSGTEVERLNPSVINSFHVGLM